MILSDSKIGISQWGKDNHINADCIKDIREQLIQANKYEITEEQIKNIIAERR